MQAGAGQQESKHKWGSVYTKRVDCRLAASKKRSAAGERKEEENDRSQASDEGQNVTRHNRRDGIE